ncbi:MAG: threonine synthase [Rhodobacteraceae bacterium]|nr:threonine synthase [Paracoccaceae bacterium]
MRYISTRGSAAALGFEDAMLTGLAADGGLYMPESWPQFSAADFAELRGRKFEEIVLRICLEFVGGSFSEAELKPMIDQSYSRFRHPARCPLRQLDNNLHLLELFHGPTLAFKDFALQLVGRMFAASLQRRARRSVIVGATSGDTGSAAIEAFRGLESVDMFILFPEGRVSEVQRRQMTTASDSNVHAIAVDGDFDACQARVKDMFNDAGFRQEFCLGAVNSINWARIVVQAAYFVAAALQLGAPERGVTFAVPTGNFGDVFAAYVAKQLGLPIDRLIVATNRNDILHRALTTGSYRTGPVSATYSPSMDIQVSSNFERALFEASDRDAPRIVELMCRQGGFEIPGDMLDRLRSDYVSGRVSENQTLSRIGDIHARTGQAVCPHTAVGIETAYSVSDTNSPVIALATAHPAKFPDAVRHATGTEPCLPDWMAELMSLPERMIRAPDSLPDLQAIIRERVSA